MTAKYEWTDDTGLRHPSLVYLDVTDTDDDLSLIFEDLLALSPVLKVKKIDSFEAMFNEGRLDHRRARALKGMEFVWHHKVMNRECYALFVAFRRKR